MTTAIERTEDVAKLLDASVVVVLKEPLPQPPDLLALLQAPQVAAYFEPQVTTTQGMALDPNHGPQTIVHVESIRSQRTLDITPGRVELHDRSGIWELGRRRLGEAMSVVLSVLEPTVMRAVGVNLEATVQQPPGRKAGEVISQLLSNGSNSLPDVQGQFLGAAVRLAYSAGVGETGTLAIEPRLNDMNSNQVWIHCNYNLDTERVPDRHLFEQAVDKALHLLQTAVRRFAPEQEIFR